MKLNNSNRYGTPIAICLGIILILGYYYFFSSLSTKSETTYLYIDEDDNIDSVYTKLDRIANKHAMTGFRTLVRHCCSYSENIKTGRYAIEPSNGAFTVFRHLKNGMQTPINLTIPSVRTLDRLTEEIGKRLMMDGDELLDSLTNEKNCTKYGYDTASVICMFIPNTYDIYWNISIGKFFDRMQKESNKFWNEERTQKAKALGLTKTDVITLASIVEEETANDSEKPMIAGMYYNRLKFRNAEYPKGMPLQADPTIKFALKQFELKRIYHNMLNINSPYNTYRYEGLPPGPIRIPTVVGIDAVLNLVHHPYLYMCAKEDFSGTHNFARTYQEHLQNAARYSKALNDRGIK